MMKNLLLMSLLMFTVSCMKGVVSEGDYAGDDGDGSPIDMCVDKNNVIVPCSSIPSNKDFIYTFNNYNYISPTGRTDYAIMNFDVNRPIVIPSELTVIEVSNSNIVNGSTFRIKFVESECSYKYNGSKFVFQSCSGLLQNFMDGDTIYLSDIPSVQNSQMNSTIGLFLYHATNLSQNGTIKISINLK